MFLGFGYFEADWIQCEVSLPDESGHSVSLGHLVEWPINMWPITLEDSLILSWMLPKILKRE